MSLSFSAPFTGQFCQESPNGRFFAAVHHGISLQIRICSSERMADQSPKIVGQYGALDQVSGLAWSPDSTMIAMWMRRRGTIEIVSVQNPTCIARIDAGLDGVKSGLWHPSSKVFFYFGRSNCHGVSLINGSTMFLDNGVKLAETWHYANELIKLDSTTGMSVLRSEDASSPGCVLRPLIQFSKCSKFIYTISPASLPTHQEGVPELFNIFLASSHQLCASFPIVDAVPGMSNVSNFVVAGSSLVVFDESHKIGAVINTSTQALDIIVETVDSFHLDSNVLVFNCRDEVLLFLHVGNQWYPMAPIPVAPKYLSSSTPILTETGGNNGSVEYTVEQTGVSFEKFTEVALSTTATKNLFYESYAKHHKRQIELAKTSPDEDLAKREFNHLSFHRCCFTSVSPDGLHVAVVSQMFPSTVFIADVQRSEMHTVLRHRNVVTAVDWHPNPNHTSMLMICTDCHDGHVFVWQPTKATTVTIPAMSFKDLHSSKPFPQRTKTAPIPGDAPVGFRPNRTRWLDSSTAVCLMCDDMRTVQLCAELAT